MPAWLSQEPIKETAPVAGKGNMAAGRPAVHDSWPFELPLVACPGAASHARRRRLSGSGPLRPPPRMTTLAGQRRPRCHVPEPSVCSWSANWSRRTGPASSCVVPSVGGIRRAGRASWRRARRAALHESLSCSIQSAVGAHGGPGGGSQTTRAGGAAVLTRTWLARVYRRDGVGERRTTQRRRQRLDPGREPRSSLRALRAENALVRRSPSWCGPELGPQAGRQAHGHGRSSERRSWTALGKSYCLLNFEREAMLDGGRGATALASQRPALDSRDVIRRGPGDKSIVACAGHEPGEGRSRRHGHAAAVRGGRGREG